MTIANDIIYLSLRNSGVNGIGQTPLADDVNDSFKVLNAWISELNLERRVAVNPIILPTFPDLTTDIGFWEPYEHVLLTSMSVRLRQIYALPPVQLDVQLAAGALKAFQAINLHQVNAPTIAADAATPYGIIYLALRAAGRVTDTQGVSPSSQDVTDAHSILLEMVDEWERERDIRVIPQGLPDLRDLNAPIVDPSGLFVHGLRNAIVLGLAVRLRDWFAMPESPALMARADKAQQLYFAINQQQIAPLVPGGVPSTVRQVLLLALRLAGRVNDQQRVSDTSADMADALSLLTMMLAQWQRKRWLIWNEAETAKLATGNQWYSVGPGGDFPILRPDKIHGGWCRLMPNSGHNPVDIPLAIIESKEDWGQITIKDLGSIPSALFYDSAFPDARLTFYPVPAAGLYELHILTKAPLPVFLTITDALSLPPEYADAVVNNLAVRMVVASGAPVSPFLLGQARAALQTIRLANSQIPLLSLPVILGGRGGDVSSWAGRGLNRAWTLGGEAVL
jgi:hypothetical protein